MPPFATRLTLFRDQIAVLVGARVVGPLLIDRGNGLLYDVERNITWLQDANYAATVRRSPDGQLRWGDARTWVAGLRYRGIAGWRLPDAREVDGSGPRTGSNYAGGEVGHLFMVAAKRMSPPDLQLTNFHPFSIYWYHNEASATEAYAFKMVGLKQGPLDKDPWGGLSVPSDKVLPWPVHNGDVGGSLFSRLVSGIRMRLGDPRDRRGQGQVDHAGRVVTRRPGRGAPRHVAEDPRRRTKDTGPVAAQDAPAAVTIASLCSLELVLEEEVLAGHPVRVDAQQQQAIVGVVPPPEVPQSRR